MQEEKEARLYKAICEGDVKITHEALAGGLDVNHVFKNVEFSPTLLHVAVKSKSVAMLKFLIEAGADMGRHDRARYTPLDDAVAQCFYPSVLYLHRQGAPAYQKAGLPLWEALEKAEAAVDNVVLTRPLAHRHLCEVFNFKTREYFALVLKEQNGAVECMNQMSFSEVKNRERLREAFEEYKARGGTADESILTSFYDDRRKEVLIRKRQGP